LCGELDNKQRKVLTSAIYGFILGSFFPLISIIYELVQSGSKFSFPTLWALHANQPLLFIIDLFPLIFTPFFALVGDQTARHEETTSQLDEQLKGKAAQLQNEHYFLEALINSSFFAVVRLDNDHIIISCNPAFEELFGYTNEEITGKYLDNLIAADDLLKEASAISQLVATGNITRKVSQRMKKDGSLVDVEIVGVPVFVGGEQIGILGLYHDISQRLETEQKLRESEGRFKSLFNESPISLWEEDFSEVKKVLDKIAENEDVVKRLNSDDDLVNQCIKLIKILDVNQATLDLYNAKSKPDLLDSLPRILVEASIAEFRKELISLATGKNYHECEIKQKKSSGEIIDGLLRLSMPPGYEETWERVYISIIDITDRKQTEEKLRFLSFHDALTGLYNRGYFEEEMERLKSSRQFPVSIIACDLDDLKQINDSLGHDVGDQAIKAAANILKSNVFRKEDVVARIGGDEFVIILPNVDLNDNPAIPERLENSIIDFNESAENDGLYRPIFISYGYAVIQSGESLMEGYKQADADMYTAKMKKKAQ
jgi:diguanylate cyclase (GGDEF)-like protein/PAS domain S-box-containing protein